MQLEVELAKEVQEWLDRYVSQKVSADDIRAALEALEPRLPELPEDAYASWAVDHVEILLAEVDRGHRTEDEIRALIENEILMPKVTIVTGTASAVTGTDAENVTSVVAVAA